MLLMTCEVAKISNNIPYSKKTLAVKSLVNEGCRKFGGKNLRELKSICIGNVMELVKIGKKNLANCCNSPKFLYRQCFLLYSK